MVGSKSCMRICAKSPVAAASLCLVIFLLAGIAQSAAIEPQSISAMEWRNIGPFRGGRVTAVEGVPSQPRTFYLGAPGGGVWRTTDGGTSWNNISDGWFKTGSVGAIAVSRSDPDIIYVGMGEHCVRDVTVSHGDGVYKSNDGGATWEHVGLPETRHISSIQIHPDDPDIVYVGSQGSPWTPHGERGVYRSVDGGRNWSLILHTNNNSGINDLVMDPHNPRVLYAAMWEHSRKPWHGYQLTSGGPGSALFKSKDGGDTWKKLTKGFPESAGKFGVAVSAADNQRVFALVEGKPGLGGLFVSDDAGESWSQVNKDHVMTQRSAYYMHVVADTQNRDVVYVLNAPMLKSIDGGKTFKRKSVPHGDNHDLWIHPEHSNWMIEANDGGANVSYNGGDTWSTQGNQPTGQFYRVNADNQFPYNLYGGQQDNSTVKIKSRTFGVGIGVRDWYPVGGGESAHIAFDPDAAELIYAGNYQGQITEFDDRSGVVRDMRHYPLGAAYRRPEEYPYRFNWNAPIVVSQHDSSVIFHGAQMVLKSTDRGQNWQEISPDLTRDETEKQGVVAGDFTVEGTAGAMYNTIFYIAESPHVEGELWVGTDDGNVHLTRDGGQNWRSITPRGLKEAQINMIEISPHQAGKAYVVATRYKFGDLSPIVYKTEDFGSSWKQIVSGIPHDDWIRVVREDPERVGLLYAGSQTSAYVSLDDGNSWGSLQLKLPHVPITDLKVHQNDLLASTEGRAFWILDDISVLRQLDDDAINAEFHLYKPAATEQVLTRGFGGNRGLGKNPQTGTTIYYNFDSAPNLEEVDVSLEILSPGGDLINRFTAGSSENNITSTAGLNRFVWNWRFTELNKKPDLVTYRDAISYRVQPGKYIARLVVGEEDTVQEFEILGDPRKAVSFYDLEQKQQLLQAIYSESEWLLDSVRSLKTFRGDIQSLAKLMRNSESAYIESARVALTSVLDAWLDSVVEESQENFIDAQHSPSRLDFSLFEVLNLVDRSDPPITQGLMSRVSDVRARWTARRSDYEDMVSNELARYNAAISKQMIPAIFPGEYGRNGDKAR